MTLPQLSESALLLIRASLALHKERNQLQTLRDAKNAGRLLRGEYTARRKYHQRHINEATAIIRAIRKTVPRHELPYVKWVVKTVKEAKRD